MRSLKMHMTVKQLPSIKLFTLFFLLFGLSANAQRKHVLDKIVAKVGDEYILYSDIQNQKLSMLQNNMAVTDVAECEILEGLLYEKLLTNQAVIDSVEVGNEIVNQEMESRLNMIAQQMPGGIKGLEEFYGKSVAQIKAEFFETIKKRMQAERMKEEITMGIEITPKEVKAFYNGLSKDSIPYINQKVEVAHIVLYPEVTKKDKEMAYDKIVAALKRVRDGEDFGDVAFDVSMDPGSRLQDGDLGWQTRGTMVPEFEAELFKLERLEISPIFETQYGYHFIQMLERKGDNYNVRHILVSPETDRRAILMTKKRLDSIHASIAKGEMTFVEAAAKYSHEDKSKNSGGKILNPYTGDYKWDLQNINEIDPQMSRMVDALRVGEYSLPTLYDNMFEGKQGVRIVKLLSKSEPHLANLHDDYQLIQVAALNEKKNKLVDEWIAKKIKANYIWIEESMAKSCKFKYEWVKVSG